MIDRHSAVGILGTVTAAGLGAGCDLYSKIAGAIAATLTVVYMIRKVRRQNKPKK